MEDCFGKMFDECFGKEYGYTVFTDLMVLKDVNIPKTNVAAHLKNDVKGMTADTVAVERMLQAIDNNEANIQHVYNIL